MQLSIDIKGLDEVMSRLDRITPGAQKQLRQAMGDAVSYIQTSAREHHKFITRSEEAERSIKTTIRSGRDSLVGTVGTTRKITIFLHQGTPRHKIVPKRKLALRWTAGGDFVFAKRVNHPGTDKDPFLFDAARREQRRVITRFERAIARATGG